MIHFVMFEERRLVCLIPGTPYTHSEAWWWEHPDMGLLLCKGYRQPLHNIKIHMHGAGLIRWEPASGEKMEISAKITQEPFKWRARKSSDLNPSVNI